MRILFADAFPEAYRRQLGDHEVDVQPDLGGDSLVTAVADAQILVVRSTKVSAEVLAAASHLELIIRAGAGTNTIDVQGSADRGIYVCNVPGTNAVAVAELTMALIGALDRRIPDNVADLRAGIWKKKKYSTADGLAGKTLAIVGLGEIGLAVAARARGFGLSVVAAQKVGRPESMVNRAKQLGVQFVDGDESLLSGADIVSLHVPLTDETRGLVDAAFLAKCHDGAWIVNTSRGEVVNESDLIDALEQRGMRAALDVFANEPSGSDVEFVSALAQHPSVYGTHHIGASTAQAQNATAQGVVDIITRYGLGEITSCVNLVETPLGACTVTVRHLDKVGVLSEVLGVFQAADVNVEQMSNQIFKGATAAVATIRVSCGIGKEIIAQLQNVDHVLGISVQSEE